jgi:hypothetical protein
MLTKGEDMSQFLLDYSTILIFALVFILMFLFWFERFAGKLQMSDKEILERWISLQKRLKRGRK